MKEPVQTTTSIATVEPQAEIPVPVPLQKRSSKLYKRWLRNAFRFDLRKFRPGADVSLRSFSITEAAFLLMLGYISSRALGVVRQTIFNALFGTSPEANAYYAASKLPDTLFDLIAGGALSHAFIPVFFAFEKERGKEEAWRLASLVFNLLLVMLTILVLISEFFAPVFVSKLLVPGYSPAEQALTTSLTRIMLVQPLILGLGTIATSILNSKRRFLLPALSIAVYNVGLIGGLLFSLAIPGVGIYGPTYGVLAAAVCQVVVMLPALLKEGVRYTFIWDLKHPGLHDIARLLGPNALSVAIASITLIVDTAFISYLPDKASLAAERNAYMLFALPVALLGQAIGQASLPQLSAFEANKRYLRLKITLVRLVCAAFVLSLLASLTLYFFGKPMIHLLFQHGAFNKHSSNVTNIALIGFAIALPVVILAQLFATSFYALRDARVPLLSNIIAMFVHWGFLFLLLQLLMKSPDAILSIPLSLAGASLIEVLFMAAMITLFLRKRLKDDTALLRLKRMREFRKAKLATQPVSPGMAPDIEMNNTGV